MQEGSSGDSRGGGRRGRTLIQQLIDGRDNVQERHSLRFDVVAVADSKQWLFAADGIEDDVLGQLVAHKQRREPLGEARPELTEVVAQASASRTEAGILVDVTAQDGMEPTLESSVGGGVGGLYWRTRSRWRGDGLRPEPYFTSSRVRHESTVGGGQPVIATMNYLLDTLDRPKQIAGQLSGTLGYICQRLDADVPFSRAIAEAKAKGFTEPDPREDLGGQDVMRKILILARMKRLAAGGG